MARHDDRPDKPGAPGYKLSSLTAFVAIDKDDDSEGIVSAPIFGMMQPLIGADDARVMQLRPLAQAISDATGVEIKLARFTVREDVDTISPKGSHGDAEQS